MTITIEGNLAPDEKTRRYVDKTIGSLSDLLPKPDRDSVSATVVLKRVNRAHGNKYEAKVKLRTDRFTFLAADTTLNVLAALDIVRRKLALAIEDEARK